MSNPSTSTTSRNIADAATNRSTLSNDITYYWSLLRIWCAGSNDSDESYLSQDHKLARRMFYCGCVGLPWLWIVNVLYFRIRIYGPIPWRDTKKQGMSGEGEHVDVFSRVHVPDVTAGESDQRHHYENATATGQEDDSDHDAAEEENDPIKEAELRKWVHRSTLGFISVSSLFIAWIVMFQRNKSSFSDNWFVMSPDDEELTGW